jgi:HEPN domain-containing protein
LTPTRNDRIFEKSYALELLRIAESDLLSAKALKGVKGVRIENSYYMIQQCIEKSLKAVIVSFEKPVPLVHDLAAIVAKLPDELNPPFGYELQALTDFATMRRYQEGDTQLSVEELDSALILAEKIYSWSEKNLKG